MTALDRILGARSFREKVSPVAEIRAGLAAREFSAAGAVDAFLARARETQGLNIFITLAEDSARKAAAESDARIAAGTARPLEGVPVAVKDNYCTNGIRTTAGSHILENFVPGYESTVTQKLLDAGAIIIGKANLDEFAMGSSTENSHFGPTINPLSQHLGLGDLAPGGSSGGSAAAVTANVAAAALGSDTGGSIRQPASFCGAVGFKPTYGTCSRWGIIAYASSLDQAGPIARSVTDAAILMDVIAGQDDKDSTSFRVDKPYAFEKGLGEAPSRLKIGFVREAVDAGNTADSTLVWDAARKLAGEIGAEIVELSIPAFRYALPAYYIIALSEASSNLARYDGVRYGYRASNAKDITDLYERSRAEGFGMEVKRRIMLGTYSLSAGYYDAYYLKAQKVRRKLADEMAAAFATVDFLFMPTAPSGAFAIGAHSSDPVSMYLEDIFTVPVNLGGVPAISVPVAENAQGLPLGLQIIGPKFSDAKLLATAYQVEQAATA